MFRIIAKQPYTPDYTNFLIQIGDLSKAKAKPADMTFDELLKLRDEREFEDSKPLMLSPYSMEQDLYGAAAGPGISVVSGNMRLLTPVTGGIGNFDFTDSQFIENFVLKESFYIDELSGSYSGDELKAKLAELDAISGKVIDDLAGAFASGIGAFFNGTQDWLSDGRPSASLANAEKSAFDVNAFKKNILDIVGQSQAALEEIKRENPGKWEDFLRTGSDKYSSFFISQLDEAASEMDAGKTPKLEEMGYGDIKAASKAINSLGMGIYTNSSAMLAAYLGQMKTESELAASHFSMSENVRQGFLAAVDRNIGIKIGSYRATWTRGLGGGPQMQQFNGMYQSFAGLADKDADAFKAGYAISLKALYDRLTEQPGTPESPRINQLNMAKGFIEQIIYDWNRFQESMGQSGGDYAVSGLLGNLVDKEI